MKVRLIHVVGYRCDAESRWGECPKGGNHQGTTNLGSVDVRWDDVGDRWPAKCDACGEPSEDRGRSLGYGPVYDTASGEPGVGDVYLLTCKQSHCEWSNCDGKHWNVVLPSRFHWDTNSRASNCTMPTDTTHRCWVVHGEGEALHVDKAGHTCAAGAGSIDAGGWHGFLHNGMLA